MTLRDEVWDAVLMQLKNRGKFKISDLSFNKSQRHTVRRVLREMDELGWVRRESKQAAIWRLGSKAEMVLDVSPDVVEAARA
jgi:DNA-binding IclR family transcriptional regulator